MSIFEFDIKAFLQTLSQRPGVYRMLDASGHLLYVGKAKNLKNRVSSYFRARGLNTKTVALVSHIRSIEVTVTGSEAEALLLEQTLIKEHRPPYNILLKDDKSYPYIYLNDHEFPSLAYARGGKRRVGKYFGPYPNSTAVRETLNYLQRIFKVRNCTDGYFSNRVRPCLQYEIDRCSAPCVRYASIEDYAANIRQAELFLQGKNSFLIKELQSEMQACSGNLEFEKAAALRDKLELLRVVQEQQSVYGEKAHADIWAIEEEQGISCVHRLSFRDGRLLGSKNFYPENLMGDHKEQLLLAFISQYYLNGLTPDGLPQELVVSVEPEDIKPLIDAIQLQEERKLIHSQGQRGKPKLWLAMALDNAKVGIQSKISGHHAAKLKLEQAAELLNLSNVPNRIECFDISHSQGEATYASCVVYDAEGLNKTRYRRFGIKDVAAGDDYAALEQATRRHLIRCAEANDLPNLLLIDGGQGQVGRVQSVVEALALVEQVKVFGISKGETRKSGWEFLWEAGNKQPIMPDAHDEGFKLLQLIRDEAHRFAITGHRKARSKRRSQSDIEQLAGVGPKRRKELLLYFGSLKNMRSAPQDELEKVPGISKKLAAQIFQQIHGQ